MVGWICSSTGGSMPSQRSRWTVPKIVARYVCCRNYGTLSITFCLYAPADSPHQFGELCRRAAVFCHVAGMNDSQTGILVHDLFQVRCLSEPRHTFSVCRVTVIRKMNRCPSRQDCFEFDKACGTMSDPPRPCHLASMGTDGRRLLESSRTQANQLRQYLFAGTRSPVYGHNVMFCPCLDVAAREFTRGEAQDVQGSEQLSLR